MSRARSKGTRYENYVLDFLRRFAPLAERAPLKGTLDHGDFVNVPWLVEAKCRAQLRPLEWARVAKAKAAREGEEWWWLVFKADDRRRTDSVGDVVMMPLGMATELATGWKGSVWKTEC